MTHDPFVARPGRRRTTRARLPLPPGTFVGLTVAITAVALIAFLTYRSLEAREAAAERVTITMEAIQRLEGMLSSLKDAETGQRGFLLTGEARYLEPYTAARAAFSGELARLRAMLAADPDQRLGLDALEQLARQNVEDLERSIELRRAGDSAGALDVVRSDRPKATMDRMRGIVADMSSRERQALLVQQGDWRRAVRLSSIATLGGSGLLVLLIGLAALVMARDYRARETQSWLRAGQMGLSASLLGEQRLDVLGERVLTFLAEYLDAHVGAVYIREGHAFRRFAGFALPAEQGGDLLRPGDGLAGQAIKENRVIHVTAVPADYLPIASSLGRARPAEILVAPAAVDGVVHGVVELGFFRRTGAAERELLERGSESLGVAVRASRDRTRLEELFEETQRQAEELQTQQEELRVNNEELEEQGRALRESHARLETQQTELEQINTQLEEQTQQLEHQRDDLARAQVALSERAEDLERANRYKSEFLANMSHELRTPLNSSLILSKMLADNQHGNLSDEQVKFAQTIFSAGNDLLVLINDILDLAKIEAGKVDVAAEPVVLAHAVDSLVDAFAPLAGQKGVHFTVTLEPEAPERIETDPQRLAQVLRNLLSNAFKFTERGEIALRVSAGPGDTVSFAVRDTGIGIPTHQHAVIFDAFRQADGSTHRKYGGTGLGLSISRDLAHVLGGGIRVDSQPGEGSVFTLTLPRAYQPPARRVAALGERAAIPPADRQAAAPIAPAPIAARAAAPVDDDRDHLSPGSRRILVIEDDARFAAILRDLAREVGFQCVLAGSAGEGLSAAATYHPSAILLDINLPDHSGLGVLDQLKRTPQTRHIPVHIFSVADHMHQALERGAIGYDLKPVKREQIVAAFEHLDAKARQGRRRVLVVEDDERQREAVRQLLAADDVEISTVETAAEALERLRTTTFDCMVMDLKLPDLSGYELLEQMAALSNVSFPPVIVYTGRTLTRDEEQRLGRFSQSIIVKDARSPERLLDEVTLFLHQVESTLPAERQRMLKAARDRETALEGRRVLVVEDDARNIFALSSVLEPRGVMVEIARNGREAIDVLTRSLTQPGAAIDLVLMDIMMPEMDGLTAMRAIRQHPAWQRLPIIALTAKAMKDDQGSCLDAGANDYIAKPLDVEKLLSLIRVWMPKARGLR